MNKLPISLCVIAGAEAARIDRCLASAAEWTSEIILVLNPEVTDGTAEIAGKYGAEVVRHPFSNFRDQKNFALEHAGQRWVLSLDADEVVSPELRNSIFAFFKTDHERFDGARFARKTWFLGRWITHGDWYPDCVLRLFKRGQAKWAGGSPEHTCVELTRPAACCTLKGDLLHYSNPTISNYVQKINYFADAHLQRQLREGVRWSASGVGARVAWRFLRAYLFRGGFLDGYPGFFIAASTAYSTLVRHSRLFEYQQDSDQAKCRPTKSQ